MCPAPHLRPGAFPAIYPQTMTRYLITGANRGLGLEFVRQLLARGDSVVACCREPESAKALQELAGEAGDRLIVRELDVTDPSAIDALPEGLPAVDVLVNNAGVAAPEERFGEFDAGTMARVLFINAIAPMLVTQGMTYVLEKAKQPKIVCVTSELGSIAKAQGLSFGLSYGMSKAALNMGVKKLAAEMKRRKIALITLHPGWVQTDMGGKNATLTPEESIRGMLKVIDGMTVADNGRYLTYAGEELPW